MFQGWNIRVLVDRCIWINSAVVDEKCLCPNNNVELVFGCYKMRFVWRMVSIVAVKWFTTNHAIFCSNPVKCCGYRRLGDKWNVQINIKSACKMRSCSLQTSLIVLDYRWKTETKSLNKISLTKLKFGF